MALNPPGSPGTGCVLLIDRRETPGNDATESKILAFPAHSRYQLGLSLELPWSSIMIHTSPNRIFRFSPGRDWHRTLAAAVLLSFGAAVRAAEPAETEKARDHVGKGGDVGSPVPKLPPRPPARRKATWSIEANGTPTCSGGWQFHFANVRGDQAYRIRAKAEYHDLPIHAIAWRPKCCGASGTPAIRTGASRP